MDTIALPKRTREGSFTDADVDDALTTLEAAPDGEAVVVGRGFESENTARNRARLMATALEAKTERFYSAHAVKHEDGDDITWIAAVSERANQAPRAPLPERPADAPSMRDLQAAARYHDIKGRSKLDYDDLSAAVLEADPDTPLSDWKGYGKTSRESTDD
jgi:hypothetical protein